MVLEAYECWLAPPQRIHQQHARIARDGDEIAPPRRRHGASWGNGPAGWWLTGWGGDEGGRIHRDQTLVGAAEQLARPTAQRLGPGEADPPGERYHAPLRVHRVQGAVRPEGGLHDPGYHGVDAPAPQVERQHVLLRGHDEQELGLGAESDHGRDRRQLAEDGVG